MLSEGMRLLMPREIPMHILLTAWLPKVIVKDGSIRKIPRQNVRDGAAIAKRADASANVGSTLTALNRKQCLLFFVALFKEKRVQNPKFGVRERKALARLGHNRCYSGHSCCGL
jgi:hypothetical protein